jgi:hypothetical protein
MLAISNGDTKARKNKDDKMARRVQGERIQIEGEKNVRYQNQMNSSIQWSIGTMKQVQKRTEWYNANNNKRMRPSSGMNRGGARIGKRSRGAPAKSRKQDSKDTHNWSGK